MTELSALRVEAAAAVAVVVTGRLAWPRATLRLCGHACRSFDLARRGQPQECSGQLLHANRMRSR
jgi:hypothetical protein